MFTIQRTCKGNNNVQLGNKNHKSCNNVCTGGKKGKGKEPQTKGREWWGSKKGEESFKGNPPEVRPISNALVSRLPVQIQQKGTPTIKCLVCLVGGWDCGRQVRWGFGRVWPQNTGSIDRTVLGQVVGSNCNSKRQVMVGIVMGGAGPKGSPVPVHLSNLSGGWGTRNRTCGLGGNQVPVCKVWDTPIWEETGNHGFKNVCPTQQGWGTGIRKVAEGQAGLPRLLPVVTVCCL